MVQCGSSKWLGFANVWDPAKNWLKEKTETAAKAAGAEEFLEQCEKFILSRLTNDAR